mmetsp:Transcript_19937/g.76471  ORF Transcript_19937/g.76471 Transcript_19937/m.76471 type:complete len:223 (-) Transcript_19937:384-1052(-)
MQAQGPLPRPWTWPHWTASQSTFARWNGPLRRPTLWLLGRRRSRPSPRPAPGASSWPECAGTSVAAPVCASRLAHEDRQRPARGRRARGWLRQARACTAAAAGPPRSRTRFSTPTRSRTVPAVARQLPITCRKKAVQSLADQLPPGLKRAPLAKKVGVPDTPRAQPSFQLMRVRASLLTWFMSLMKVAAGMFTPADCEASLPNAAITSVMLIPAVAPLPNCS